MDIHVVCDACGTELETPDANVDVLLTVVVKVRPCPKCNRPPDCQLSCEDVLDLKKKLKTFTNQKPSHAPSCWKNHKSKIHCEQCTFRTACKATTE